MDGSLIAPLARDLSGLSRLGFPHQPDAKKGRQERSNHASAYEASPTGFSALVLYISSTQIGSLVANTPSDAGECAKKYRKACGRGCWLPYFREPRGDSGSHPAEDGESEAQQKA
jgi:hypothetical protein